MNQIACADYQRDLLQSLQPEFALETGTLKGMLDFVSNFPERMSYHINYLEGYKGVENQVDMETDDMQEEHSSGASTPRAT
jgi:hypothetical protein